MNKSDVAGLHAFCASPCLPGRVFLGVVIEAQAKDRHHRCWQGEAAIGKCEDSTNRYLGSSSPSFLNSFMDLAAEFQILLVRMKPIYPSLSDALASCSHS